MLFRFNLKESWLMTTQEEDESYLGQFIPLQYHFFMLEDKSRMQSFKAAINHVVTPGARVLDLGGGTGVMSWFAAQQAEKVWCVEFNPDLVQASRQFLDGNVNGHRVEVIHANAFDYLPPEPVDVMICEMIHAAMLREKQIEIIESFKQRYRQRFGPKLPIMVPTAEVLAVQPLQQEFMFEGYHAPVSLVQDLSGHYEGCVELAQPAAYRIFDFNENCERDIAWEGTFDVAQSGTVTALRFITRNILAVLLEQKSSIDWLNRHLVLPLPTAVPVQSGDVLRVSFSYRAGGSIMSLQNALRAEVISR